MVGYTPQNNTNTPIKRHSNVAGEIEHKNQEKDLHQSLEEILQRFDPISLEEMDKVKLMNRIDTKFLVSAELIPTLLLKAVEHYRIVEINEIRTSPYSSIYFDTDDFEMYVMHHNGKLNRHKVRMRTYLNSGISFLEIKKKSNKGRTSKKRIKIPQEHFQNISLDETEQLFIKERSPYQYTGLKPSLQNYFHRITLVDKNKTERVTIDIELKFRKVGIEDYTPVNGLAIIEMKQSGATRSYFRQYLNELAVLPRGMSKYCLGMILTNPELKNNNFKRKIRYINKIAKSDLIITKD